MRALAFLVALLAGCSCGLDHVTLGPEWSPIRRVQKDASIPDGIFRLKLDVLLTSDPCSFVRASSVQQEGLRRHEVHHAKKQAEMGLDAFERDYANDPGFRFDEERAGWSLQIRYVSGHGEEVDPFVVTRAFDEVYKVGDHDATLAWVLSEVAAGRRGEAPP